MLIFVLVMAIILPFTAEPILGEPYTAVAFVLGAVTSLASGYIGMAAATYTNVRTTKECAQSIGHGFVVAYRGGEILGFALVGLALLNLTLLIVIVRSVYDPIVGSEDSPTSVHTYRSMFEVIAGYGFGGSSVALFGRVGGGIYTKAADVGADLAGKVCEGLEEDDPSNPGTIADNVGDNVGDIAGMGADLFGSLAEATCAALVVSATSTEILESDTAIWFPLTVTGAGILVSFITCLFATNFTTVTETTVERCLKWQLFISTFLMTASLIPLITLLPETFTVSGVACNRGYAFWCIFCGLWSGMFIGFITEYYTSASYEPVINLAEACRMGAAPNIILGLALGYWSNVIPVLCLCGTIYVSFTLAGMYGIALAAIGMLGCLPVALAIDGYGPIADNAGGIAEMTGLHPSVRRSTDKLDAAGNTTAAIGKGFAIGSAALVGLALFGAFVTRTKQDGVNVLKPLLFAGLLLGAMLPYAFSALTMAAVGDAANEMITEIKRQFDAKKVDPDFATDYEKCIAISTNASLKKMVAPGLLVLLTPMVVGVLFGPEAVSGLLAGAIVSGVQVAFSMSNTGGAWDNAKKYVEAGNPSRQQLNQAERDGEVFYFAKHTDAHAAAVVGDTVGDPLKDTSGPAINIVIKLSAITSLVFGQYFVDTSFLNRK